VQLNEAARRLLEVMAPEGVLIGGICGFIYGVERYTRDIDLATTLDAEKVISRLRDAGIEADMRSSNEPGDLSWVISGEIEGVEFQILPAAETGMDGARVELKAGLRVPDINSFIVSKCIAAGQQDMHDVAALCMMHPGILMFAKSEADKRGCLNKLESWLDDRRLQQRYASTD